MRSLILKDSFSLRTLLWLLLGVGTAYRLGVGATEWSQRPRITPSPGSHSGGRGEVWPRRPWRSVEPPAGT